MNGLVGGHEGCLPSECPGPSSRRGAMPQTQVHCLFQRPAVSYFSWLFLLGGRLARHGAKDRDVRKKVACAKKEVSG